MGNKRKPLAVAEKPDTDEALQAAEEIEMLEARALKALDKAKRLQAHRTTLTMLDSRKGYPMRRYVEALRTDALNALDEANALRRKHDLPVGDSDG